MGDRVSIGPFVQMWAHGGVRIGSDVMIAAHAVITTSTHDLTVSPMNSVRKSAEIVIEDDVWIGSGAMIMPGVTLGSGSVVGAGAVVTRSVPPMAIVVGVPARILRFRNADGNKSEGR